MQSHLNRQVSLSPKDLRFLMGLIDDRLAQFEVRLRAATISEDETSDILNDKFFLEGLRTTLDHVASKREDFDATK